MQWLYAAIGFVAGGVILGVIAWRLGFNYRKKSAEQQIGYAEDEAKRIINEALKTAESKSRTETKPTESSAKEEAKFSGRKSASSRRKSPLTRR